MNFAQITSSGSRVINEDCIRCEVEKNKGIFVLADGLGGHGYGDLASQTVTCKAVEAWRMGNNQDIKSLITQIFESAQEELLFIQRKNGLKDNARTTMVVTLFDRDQYIWGHIGDSRLYYFKSGRVQERTLDHSVTQMLVFAGKLKEKQIRGHEDRTVLLRAMGIPWNIPKYEIGEKHTMRSGDAILMCSDGFWELIVEKKMEKLLKKTETVDQWIYAMSEHVLKNGRGTEMDNYSAVGIYI